MKSMILEMARHAEKPLTPWFDSRLDDLIKQGWFCDVETIKLYRQDLVAKLRTYRERHGVDVATIGMSGGVDSALTAVLFKEAGWRVLGYTLPINQDPAETARGIEACEALGIEHEQVDLTALYEATVKGLGAPLLEEDSHLGRIRRGNLRARLRMMTLYDRAQAAGGLVASTDNFSELSAGFWTLHGDVGDVSPIQALLKSWEVPMMARLVGVPESIWRAHPTDGLGIDSGDEAQLGASYLEWDIMLISLFAGLTRPDDEQANRVYQALTQRMRGSWFKRHGSVFFNPAKQDRFTLLSDLDKALDGQV